jgi:hypothetical protein
MMSLFDIGGGFESDCCARECRIDCDRKRNQGTLKSLHDDFPLPAMTVNDRVDRRRPVTGWYIVPQERKLETAAAEKPPRLKGRGKSETTP